MIVKEYLSRFARKFGFELIPSWRMRTWEFAIHLARLFERLKIDCVFDVGAYVGWYGDFLRNEVRWDGLILSFEPVSRSFDKLMERAKQDDFWIPYNYALGNRLMWLNQAKDL